MYGYNRLTPFPLLASPLGFLPPPSPNHSTLNQTLFPPSPPNSPLLAWRRIDTFFLPQVYQTIKPLLHSNAHDGWPSLTSNPNLLFQERKEPILYSLDPPARSHRSKSPQWDISHEPVPMSFNWVGYHPRRRGTLKGATKSKSGISSWCEGQSGARTGFSFSREVSSFHRSRSRSSPQGLLGENTPTPVERKMLEKRKGKSRPKSASTKWNSYNFSALASTYASSQTRMLPSFPWFLQSFTQPQPLSSHSHTFSLAGTSTDLLHSGRRARRLRR